MAKLKLIQAGSSEPGLSSQGKYSSNLTTSGKQAGKKWVQQRCCFEVEMGKSPFLAAAGGGGVESQKGELGLEVTDPSVEAGAGNGEISGSRRG